MPLRIIRSRSSVWPGRAVRAAGGVPAVLFDRLAALSGDVGGMAAVPGSGVPVRLVEAAHPWELWDADTPAALTRLEDCLAQNDR